MARGDSIFSGLKRRKRSKSLDRKPRRSKTVAVRFADLPKKGKVEISGPTGFRRVRSFSECPGLEGFWSDSDEPSTPPASSTPPGSSIPPESPVRHFIA